MNDTPENTHYRLAIRRPVTVAMMFLTLLVFGMRSYQQLPLNLMPDQILFSRLFPLRHRR